MHFAPLQPSTDTSRKVFAPPAAMRAEASEAADEPGGRPLPTDPEAALYPAEVAHLCGVEVRTLEKWRLRGGGPAFIGISRRCIRYRRRDVLEWIESRRRRSTSDDGCAR